MSAALYLIPTFIGAEGEEWLPPHSISQARSIRCFIVEREKTARAFLRSIGHPIPQSDLLIHELDKHEGYRNFEAFFDAHIGQESIGLLSEAGLPAVADPGAQLVRYAHRNGVEVRPLSGSSSIFLALMASGMDGQDFHFSGYLPIERAERLAALKRLESAAQQSTQIFMEAPYRNDQFLEFLLSNLNPNTRLCVAAALETPQQNVRSMQVRDWPRKGVDLHKLPCIYLIKRD